MKAIKVFGGPWNHQLVGIPSNGTLEFKLGKFEGYYDKIGTWVAKDKWVYK
jgi:hypothetical protein